MTDRLRPERPDDGSMDIRGGVGGIRFQWDELDHAARVLALLSADTADVATALGHLDADVAELPWRIMHLRPTGGVAGPYYQAARAQLGSAWSSAAENGRLLATTEERLRVSLRAYRLADTAAVAATEAARSGTGATARALARGAMIGGALQVGPIDLRGASFGAGGSHTSGAGSSFGAVVAFDGTVEGVVKRVAAVEAEGAGTFEVLRLGTDADPVYMVVLPGTQTRLVDGVAGSNPFDAGGVAEALAEDSRYTEAAVLEALAQAGARQGDALMLAGYSQGGMHAVNLAGSGGLGGQYDVQLVLTVGSPTGWQKTNSGEYLHLEHAADAVPGLDSSPNGDDRHRTTVTLTHPVPPLGQAADGSPEPWGLGPAHKLKNYAEGARLVDASSAPSLVLATALLATAGARGTAHRSTFTAVRRVHPKVKPGPGATPPPAGAGLGYGHDFDR
ncbi:hypothetical protein D6T63_14410 [Arthrobacter cheniae]|uniref:PE-PPE domain-containing protein n=1 Tax=Arthrobacter cheniae TaxID=1258888 RepID=A0A3A5MB56_9MICC|nr:hypothetical protein [Arthrobacter cheniae]RJT77740.1 hypothetical protein D6T63_14410 [Arthrobacter cheniae]